MNTSQDKHERDTGLVDGLENVEQVYRQLEQPEPPDLVDQAVLNSARRAVESKPRLMRVGWLRAVTTVALFGLAISIILKYPGVEVLQEADFQSNGQVMPMAEEEQLTRRSSKIAVESDKQLKEEVARSQADVQEVAASPRGDIQNLTIAEKSQRTRPELRAGRQAKEPAALRSESAEPFSDDREANQAVLAESIAPAEIGFRDVDESVEERLARILDLKEAGDESWKKELDEFVIDYPDYELPESLKPPSD